MRPPRSADRLLVVLSDIEMGSGGPTDDFPHDAWLADLIERRTEQAPPGTAVDLVFNGDTFDFLKTSFEGRWPRHVDARLALGKLDRIAAAHPRFFEAVAAFLSRGRDRRVVYVTGNHDAELAFPEVQGALRQWAGAQDRVLFAGAAFRVGDVHVEHGQQADVMFAMDFDNLFVEVDGRPVLNLPWGSVALLDVAMPMQPLLYHTDRVKPRERVLELMPEMKELIVSTFWRYWTRDYLRELWEGAFSNKSDPLHRLTWTMFKEIVYRFSSADAGLSTADSWQDAVKQSDEVRLVILGHEHCPSAWSWGDRKILRSGCLRDEYMASEDGHHLRHLPKAWVEAWMEGDTVLTSGLVEELGPLPPAGHLPDSIFDVLPVVRSLLGSRVDRRDGAVAQAEQEAAEAHIAWDDDPIEAHPARSLEITEELQPVSLAEE